jgi:hypothetical protein
MTIDLTSDNTNFYENLSVSLFFLLDTILMGS